MGKKKSAKVLIVGNNPQLSKTVEGKKSLLDFTQTNVSRCDEALQVASKQPPFDLLFTDITMSETERVDFTEQFSKISPKTEVIYTIL